MTDLPQFDGGSGKGDPFQGGNGEANLSVLCVGYITHYNMVCMHAYISECVCAVYEAAVELVVQCKLNSSSGDLVLSLVIYVRMCRCVNWWLYYWMA